MKENKKLRGGIFSMWPLLSYNSLEVAVADIAVIAGLLTNRPEEEVSGSSNDLLQELSQLHEQAQRAMWSVAKALWPFDPPSRKHGGAGRAIQGSAVAYLAVEDICLPRGCARGLGHGEDAIYQAGS